MLYVGIAAAWASLIGVICWAVYRAGALDQKLKAADAAQKAKEAENAVVQAGIAAGAPRGDVQSDELSARPLPVQDYRD